MNAPAVAADVGGGVVQRLRLAGRFSPVEVDSLVGVLAALGARLRFRPDDVLLVDLVLDGRHSTGQRLSLQCWVPGPPRVRLAATSAAPDLLTALEEVLRAVVGQAEVARSWRESARAGRADTSGSLRPAPDQPTRVQTVGRRGGRAVGCLAEANPWPGGRQVPVSDRRVLAPQPAGPATTRPTRHS